MAANSSGGSGAPWAGAAGSTRRRRHTASAAASSSQPPAAALSVEREAQGRRHTGPQPRRRIQQAVTSRLQSKAVQPRAPWRQRRGAARRRFRRQRQRLGGQAARVEALHWGRVVRELGWGDAGLETGGETETGIGAGFRAVPARCTVLVYRGGAAKHILHHRGQHLPGLTPVLAQHRACKHLSRYCLLNRGAEHLCLPPHAQAAVQPYLSSPYISIILPIPHPCSEGRYRRAACMRQQAKGSKRRRCGECVGFQVRSGGGGRRESGRGRSREGCGGKNSAAGQWPPPAIGV